MADQYNDKTYVRETRTEPATGGSMALIVGGLVVAVGFILWLVFGGTPVTTTTTDPASETTNVTIEPPAVEPTTNVTVDGAEPAPADTGAAPADTGTAPADAAPAETAPADGTETAPANP